MKTCDYNHLILYAKGHYEQSDDILRDVKTILAERCGLESADCVSDVGLWEMVSHALLQYRHDRIDQYLKELFKPMADENDYGPLVWFTDTCPLVRAVRCVLSQLRSLPVLDREGNKILELGDPDSAILPLSEYAKKRLEKVAV